MRRWSCVACARNEVSQFRSYAITRDGTTAMTISYVESFLSSLYQSLTSFKYFQIRKYFSPSMPHKLYQMQRITSILPLYHYWNEEWTSDVLNKSILKNKYDSLVDEATHIFDTIVLIFFRKKLMCVPYEIYVQSWYKDFMGRWSHEIQETNKLSIKLEIKKQDNK